MIQFELTGDWWKVHNMFLRRRSRQQSLKHRVTRSVVKQFRKTVLKNIPEEERLKKYKKSIKLRRILGQQARWDVSYAVVSIPWAERLDRLEDKQTVVYLIPNGQPISPLGLLLSGNNPWRPSRLPRDMADVQGVRLVHRRVSEDEAKRVAEDNDRLLDAERRTFEEAGYQPDPKGTPEGPESVPDTSFQATRMEFGINEDRRPHWTTAWRQRQRIIDRALRKHSPAEYIFDPYFNGWAQRVRKMKTMSAHKFVKDYSQFGKMLEKQG